MAVVAEPIGVINLALDHVGQPPIATIDPPVTKTEILMARHYDTERRRLLRKGVWNFAKRRTSITLQADVPAFDFSDSYLLPNDFIRLLSVKGDKEVLQSQDYDIQGKYVFANAEGASSIKLRYIADVTDVALWDAQFLDLLVLYLARSVAYTFTKDEAVVKRLNDLIMVETPETFAVDGQERPPLRIQRSVYRDARMGSLQSPGYYVDFED